jgi:hypothetical protein
MERSDGTAHERPVTSASHLGVERDFLELVQGIGGRRAQGSAECSRKQHGDRCWKGRNGEARHCGQYHEERKSGFRELGIIFEEIYRVMNGF